jgi:hypothetical protein
MRALTCLFAAGTVLVATTAFAQGTSFSSRVGRNPVGVGEVFPYEVSLSMDNASMEDYRPPDFRGFRVVASSRASPPRFRWVEAVVLCATSTPGTTNWSLCKKAS